jgi:hypothetical protein
MNKAEYNINRESTLLERRLNPMHKDLDIVISEKDKQILRELGGKIADIGSLPTQQKLRQMWSQLNQLEDTKPMVWMEDICWDEMDVDGELKIQTSSPFCQRIELDLRQTIYRWNHMPCDMVVDTIVYSPLVTTNSGIGISIEEDIIKKEGSNTVASHHYRIQIREEEDIEKINTPKIARNEKKSEENYQAYCDIFDGILPVKKRGVTWLQFAPWDDIIHLTGVQEALLDLAMRPEYIHKLVDRFVDAQLHALDQYEKLNLLALNNNNVRIGSGGYGYTDELPQSDYDHHHTRTLDTWGYAAAQIFVGVSPKMHEEFALKYEKRWLERFGLTYYGCCEPLHKNIHFLRSIPNLRKISISPWADINEAASQILGDYVISLKPNPAILATDKWHPERAREELETKLKAAKQYNCKVEIIMKDISTVHHEPQRLWEWARIATELADKFV